MSVRTGDLFPLYFNPENGMRLRPRGPLQWFRSTGRRGPVPKGGAYISGAIPALYVAPNDLEGPHLLAEEVPEPAPCRCPGCPSAVAR